MKTNFDDISDDEIEKAIDTVGCSGYSVLDSHLKRIAWLAWMMDYMKAWIDWPVTFFSKDPLDYDGHHRVRAAKYLMRRRNLQIQIPVRFSKDV